MGIASFAVYKPVSCRIPSPPERPLGVEGRPGRKKKRARGEQWKGGREKRGSRTLSIFSIIAIFKIPIGSLCGGESPALVNLMMLVSLRQMLGRDLFK